MSTRVEGAAPPVIRVTAQAVLAAGTTHLMLTIKEESENLWRYNLAEGHTNRVAYGRVTMPDHMTVLRHVAAICADGYPPGSIERGLLEAFARDAL